MRVSLVNTMHEERGALTVASLVALLEKLKPQVVFAEIPNANAERYRDGSHGNLESLAVADYLTRRPVEVVPVDLDEPDENFFRTSQEMFKRVERTNLAHKKLVEHHTDQVRSFGLRYLNGPQSLQVWRDIDKVMRETLDWIRDDDLHAMYAAWCEMKERRERGMLGNILACSAESPHDSAVFLVGAAHRESLIDKARSEYSAGIEWQLELPSQLFD